MKRQKHSTGPIPSKKTRQSTSASFNFQQHCIFCGELCNLKRDSKHPDRWRDAYLCREIEEKGRKTSFKAAIIQACNVRSDNWAADVRLRVEGAISDFHAADARYHVDCKSRFMSPKSLESACNTSTSGTQEVDTAWQNLLIDVQDDLTRIWNSVELANAYQAHGGNQLSRKLLVKKLAEYVGSDLLVLSSVGIANIIVFRSKAATALKVIEEDEDDLDAAIAKVSKQIIKDVKANPADKTHYNTRINH